ncbi:MBL fold metallo-hydrolase [Bacillus sp. FJAT-27251]|uniref:MBL fold metallo-hydrolase n=1 Tax=Bacillus sp. FJAT-27251 TaxID=1684142 RepID=UPI0006A77244|nr:MBL fold metallo-hydrolase [Bacillus sp. FJAT-27251]
MGKPMQLTEKIHLIDGHDLGMEERTGSYVLLEDDITLIETSASPSVQHILAGLKDLGLPPSDIKYIIVTHIHLDHSGGCGLLLTYCPNAKIIVHPKGARHLADPSRLIASAKAVYREKFEALFDPILPVPEENILVKADGETLQVSEDCILTFHDSPGHANHHFSIFHPGVKGLFSGDTIGIYYPQLARKGIELYIPSTSPNQFDPDKMLHSLETFEQLKPERLFFGHFGMSEHPAEAYRQVKYWLEVFCSTAEAAFDEGSDFEERTNLAAQKLYERVKNHLLENGLNDKDPILELLSLDLQISSMGLVDYLTRKK